MFGVDKNLKNTEKIEQAAERETVELSALDLEGLAERLKSYGIENFICSKPTHYLCNEAYWYILRKLKGRAVFIHIPSIKIWRMDLSEK